MVSKKGINSIQLKKLAIGLMVIDHIGAALLEPILLSIYGYHNISEAWLFVDFILRLIGRLSFPLFCFVLVEGFIHTHDIKKYIIMMVSFAFLSEIPFDLAFSNILFDFSYQNVFFTLAIGLCVLQGLKLYRKSLLKMLLIIITGCIVSIIMVTDYSYIGILLISIFYIFHNQKKQCYIVSGWLLVYETITHFGIGIVSLIPIHLYNGEKGNRHYKYFYYWFYPVHLLLFYMLRTLILSFVS